MATSMEAALKASLHRRLMEKHPVFFGIFRKTPQSILELYYRTASGSVYRSIKQKVGREFNKKKNTPLIFYPVMIMYKKCGE